jgi:hypothetical protein
MITIHYVRTRDLNVSEGLIQAALCKDLFIFFTSTLCFALFIYDCKKIADFSVMNADRFVL